MIGTIIVPLDGSEFGERALTYARPIAEKTGASVRVARIAPPDANEQEVALSRDYLRHVSHTIAGRVQIDVERGRPAPTIVRIAEEAIDPIIVMSTHGYGAMQRWFTGSVADEVVRSAGVPVLLVSRELELPARVVIRSILLPLDGSAYAESAIEWAAEIAAAFGSEIHLARVVDTPSAYAMLSRHIEVAATGDVLDEIIQSMTREATQYLDGVADDLTGRGLDVRKIVLDGYPGEELIAYERQGHFQLVVMATAGRSGVSRIVFGSVAERMLKMGRTPVMMVRPPESTEAGTTDQDAVSGGMQ